jgi:hypothetical protein
MYRVKKVNTGPLEKFTGMLKNNIYGIMVNHVDSEFSEVVLVVLYPG